MTYPYPELIPLLKYKTTPKEYVTLVKTLNSEMSNWERYGYDPKGCGNWSDTFKDLYSQYESLLPEYLYARCPFCGRASTNKFDTYTLRQYFHLKGHLAREGMHGIPHQPSCEHYLGTHHMINLHGAQSFEFELFSHPTFVIVSGEVPYIGVPRYLIQDKDFRHVVLHTLPVCTIQDNQFVPTYTHFILTYYVKDVEEFRAAYHRWIDGAHWASMVANYAPYKFTDLEPFARSGELGWLDFTEPDTLPLAIGENHTLPTIYQKVEGHHGSILWERDEGIIIRR